MWGIIIGLLIIGVVCWGLGSALESIGKSSEENSKRKRQEKVNEYSYELDKIKVEFVKGLLEKYENTKNNIKYLLNNDIRTIDEVSIYSLKNERGYEKQTINIWIANQNLFILTNKTYLLEQAEFFKRNMSEYVGLPFNEVEKQLKEIYRTNERFLIHNYCIPVEKIEYYLLEGDVYTSTSVYGGGGTIGGNSMKGAIVGGVLAGGAGAIIGSRKEEVIQEIKSNTTIHDKKYVIIKYKNSDDLLKEVRFDKGYSRVYDILKDLIPEKEYTYIMKNTINSSQNNNNCNDISNRLLQIKELYEKKLISNEEYDIKRNEILNKL